MKIDLHVHTAFCDGNSTAEEIVDAAIGLNMEVIGFSGHSYVEFDPEYSMSPDDTDKYFEEISRLKEKYKGKIRILCGIEQDYFSSMPIDRYDYVIGSVHYLKCGDRYVSVDSDKKTLITASQKYFSGDIYSLIEEYYTLVGGIADKTRCNIIGHFDLVEKFNEAGDVFDRHDSRYISAYRKAADSLLNKSVVFEVNTGAISRGYKTVPYPDIDILRYICGCGGRVLLSSDSHSADTLCFKFDEAEGLLRTAGFKKSGIACKTVDNYRFL